MEELIFRILIIKNLKKLPFKIHQKFSQKQIHRWIQEYPMVNNKFKKRTVLSSIADYLILLRSVMVEIKFRPA